LGSLTKQGSGVWTIDKDLSAPASTNVIAGTLNVAENSALTSPLVTIENGGTLMGSGIISGNLTNFGLVSPGNSPGTLTVSGDYTQSQNGRYVLKWRARVRASSTYWL
jgi:fibronectin-binding autotransporter adhesin